MLNFYEEQKYMQIKLRTTNIIERTFREVRRRTRPIGCFTNERSVERIVYAIFYRQNIIWKRKPLWKDSSFIYKKPNKSTRPNYEFTQNI